MADYTSNYTGEQIDAAVGWVRTKSSDVEAAIGSLNTWCGGLETRSSTNSDNITALQGRMTTAEGDIDALESDVEETETAISGLGTRLTTAEGNITSQGTRLTTAEGDIDALESDVEEAKNALAGKAAKGGNGAQDFNAHTLTVSQGVAFSQSGTTVAGHLGGLQISMLNGDNAVTLPVARAASVGATLVDNVALDAAVAAEATARTSDIEALESRATQDEERMAACEGNSTHYSLVGNGDTRVGIQLGQRLKPATSYVVLFRGDWAVDEITLATSTSRFRVLSNGSAISKSNITIAANVPIAKYFTVPADSERTSVSLLANAGEKVEFDIVKTNVFSPIVYFSSRQYPTFERLVNKIKVTFPNYINIHDEATGERIAGFNVSGQSFELAERQRLVYDLADGTLKVVLVEANGDYINLLVSYGDKYCGGLLAHYLDNQRFAVVNDKLNLVKWEIGAVNFSVTPWTYSDANNRVRVAQNDFLHLNKGDIITLTDYANAKMYVAWISGGVYGRSSGWLQEDFVCETDGDYSMLLAYVDNSVVADASELSDLVKIIPVWSTLDERITAVNEKADAVGAKADGLDLGVLNPDMFDIGEVNLNATPWTYADGTRSVRLKEEAKLFLKTGDVIRLTDYSNCMIFISYRNGEDYYRTGWLTSGSFVCPVDAEYSMLLRHPSNTFGNVVADKWQFLRYLRIERGKECPFDIAKQTQKAFSWLMDNPNLRAVNHRGYNTIAPENTLSAFRLSAEMGFKWVELDVQWTSDGVPVILHDATIDRTSNGTGAIKDLSLAEVRQYDFGSWKSEEYAGEQIPTFEEALKCCKWAGLKIYVEIKTATLSDAKADLLASMIKGTGMSDACDFIQANSANVDALKKMGALFPQARLGYVKPTASSEEVALARIDELLPPNHTVGNKVFADLAYSDSVLSSSTFIPELIGRGVELELWDCRYSRDIVSTYVTGVTINSVITNQGLNGA